MSSSWSKVVSTMIPAPGSSARIWRIACTPSSLGMRKSISVTSVRNRRHSATASSPSPASPTTLASSSMFIIAASPRRTSGWSSAISTRIKRGAPGAGSVSPRASAASACLRASIGDLASRTGKRTARQQGLHPRAAACAALHHQAGADALGALAHAEQPETVVARVRIEADAVIGDRQRYRILAEGERHVHALRQGMLHHVGDGFLRDAQQLGLYL